MASAPREIGDGWETAPLRSLLFAPGSDARKLGKVATFGADIVVLDLEDAVAADRKDEARRQVREALPQVRRQATTLVRVNGAETGLMAGDIEAVGVEELDGIVIPKVEEPELLSRVDQELESRERAAGVQPGTVRILALVETALGVARSESIALAAPPRVVTLVFGLVDFSSDVQIDLSDDGTELLYARSRIVVAARAARMRPPVDGPFLALHDHDALLRDTQRSRQLGFQGRVVVYPPQLEAVHQAYSDLRPDDVERNRRIVAAFEQAEASGIASVQVDGLFVDYPAWQRARQKLQMFDALHVSNASGG